VTRTRRILVLVGALGLLLALTAPLAQAAPTALNVTGSAGRDDLDVNFRPSSISGRDEVIFTPAVGVVATNATCTNESDPLTLRARETRCIVPGSFDLTIDLGAGDDELDVDFDEEAPVDNLTISGGLRNDFIKVSSTGAQAIRGGDGDDTLGTDGMDTRPVTLDGGAGRDLVDYGSPGQVPSGYTRAGVSASLATGTATWFIGRRSGFPDITRTDSLTGVERLSGTESGDRLTGGTAGDELIGESGPDDLTGGAGNDTLGGGDGVDELSGGDGTDNLDGGTSVDSFRFSAGGDTMNMRDGFAERISCVNREIVVNDLADAVDNPAGCTSVSTAAAKHRLDTTLSSRRLRIGPRRRVAVRVACPRRKPDRCAGVLSLRRLRGAALAARRYRLAPGHAALLRFALTRTQAARLRGRVVMLAAAEVDGDGRDRSVLRRTSVR
jgi:hypothetical protein